MHIALLFFSLLYGFFFFFAEHRKGHFSRYPKCNRWTNDGTTNGDFFYGFNRSGRRQSKYFMM
jgi:hypothetical protein